MSRPKTDVPSRLRSWRAAAGLTQTQAARHLMVPVRTYQGWEIGKMGRMTITLLGLLLAEWESTKSGVDDSKPC